MLERRWGRGEKNISMCPGVGEEVGRGEKNISMCPGVGEEVGQGREKHKYMPTM